jgi:hypothetical protein
LSVFLVEHYVRAAVASVIRPYVSKRTGSFLAQAAGIQRARHSREDELMAWIGSLRPAAAVAIASLGLAAAGAAYAATPFTHLGGNWSGSGSVRLERGTEAIRCNANYVARGGGNALGLSLRCASSSNRIDLRASLTLSGSRVSGQWEERSFNASGYVSGQATGSILRLRISGSIEGSMVVTTSGVTQSISVRTDASALRGVNVSLRRRN